MEKVNYQIACNVENCSHNYAGVNCTLGKIKVGCACGADTCTCCESYDKKY